MARPPTGRTTTVVRVPTGIAAELRARATAAGSTVGALIASLLTVPVPAPLSPPPSTQPSMRGRAVLVGAVPQPSRPSGERRVGHCSCKSPSLSTLVSNLCTNCGQLR